MKIVVLTGAGISAESGISTFRDQNGLWEGHDVMEVASPEGFKQNMQVVLNFYNQRRKQVLGVEPNIAHQALAKLEEFFNVQIFTQNVDNLHEKAGSTQVNHLHGELLKARSSINETIIVDWEKDILIGDLASDGSQLRPHIVWFGEAVPMIEKAISSFEKADIIMVVGTSLQVYPAAGLIDYAPLDTPIYLIDPNPQIKPSKRINIYPEKATIGVIAAVEDLIKKYS